MLSEFLTPVSQELRQFIENLDGFSIGANLYFDYDFEEENDNQPKIAIFGVEGSHQSREGNIWKIDYHQIRKQFYQLKKGNWSINLYDLGDVEYGASKEDLGFAFYEVHKQLLREGFVIIVLGATSDLSYFQYRSFDQIKSNINLVSVDHKIRFGNDAEELSSNNFLSKIISAPPYNLFEYTHVGHQTYFVAQEELDLMEHLNFEMIRLGEVVTDMQEVEPSFRDSDLLHLSLNVLQQSSFSSNTQSSPNGLTSREICGLIRYAGLSNKIKSIYLSEYLEKQIEVDHMLMAQMLWYFIEGKNYAPDNKNFEDQLVFEKFYVPLEEQDIVFYRNMTSNQWWIELKNMIDVNNQGVYIIPCSKKDYEQAIESRVPDRWWRAYKKLY